MNSRKPKPLPPLERLRELLDYNPDTGALTWRVNRKRARAGVEAGHLNEKLGYVLVGLEGEFWWAHRLAWFMHHGVDPGAAEVDHKNGRRCDNRASNLRLCGRQGNASNVGRRKDSTSGHVGVYWHQGKRKKRWQARICSRGVQKSLGYFTTFEEAVAARRAAELEHFGEFAPHLCRPEEPQAA